MADTPDGKDPIPDLKKVAETRAAAPAFDWSRSAKSAASVQSASPRTKDLTLMDRLNTTGGRIAVMAVVMLIAGGAISVTMFREEAGSSKSNMEGLKSTIKNSYASDTDSTGFHIKERDDSKADRMKVGKKDGRDPITGEPLAIEIPEIPAVPEGGDGMNYDAGGTSRGAGVAAGGANAGGKNGNGGSDSFSQGGGGMNAPKLSSTGQIKFQGMRRVSGTAGFRGIQGRGAPSRTINNRGTSSNNSSADSAGNARAGGSGFTSLRDQPTSAGGLATGGKAGKDGSSGGGEGGGGGGGSGGGGADVNTEGLDELDDDLPGIPGLLAKAESKREKADKEEQKGHALMVLGQHPQAAYHFKKSKDYKKEAEELEKQAKQQTQAMKDGAAGITQPKDN